MQTAIPCTLMRGGTSKGPFFMASDLPRDAETRDRVLLAVMGSPDVRQIDGLGGADPLTSKIGIVGPSTQPGVDVEFLFAQLSVDRPLVDTRPNCGNMLAAVVPFAIEEGLITPSVEGATEARVLTVNTGMLADITVNTPGGILTYEGDCRIDGVPGAHAPIALDFLDIAGSVCASLLPTGSVLDEIDGIAVTCIDHGMPVVVLGAEAMGKSGYESCDELTSDADFMRELEKIRLKAGVLMGLGDVGDMVVPKMTLVAGPRRGGAICTRTFIPRVCHSSIGVLGAVSVATACVLPGSMPSTLVETDPEAPERFSLEHPSGRFTLELEVTTGPEGPEVQRAALLRTARKLFAGSVYIPSDVWAGPPA